MGSTVIAQCPCGYEAELAVGGGRRTYRTICYFPCLCKGCRKLVQANLLADPLACPDCGSAEIVPYDQPELAGASGESQTAHWAMEHSLGRDLVLTDGTYRCPACESPTLRFLPWGLFD